MVEVIAGFDDTAGVKVTAGVEVNAGVEVAAGVEITAGVEVAAGVEDTENTVSKHWYYLMKKKTFFPFQLLKKVTFQTR